MFGPIFSILILLGVVQGIIHSLRLFGASSLVEGSRPGYGRAMGLLEERFAEGEIATRELGKRKKLLND